LRSSVEALRLDPNAIIAEAADWAADQLDHSSS
jgi:hypothetical protein